eukprot:4781627-Prymnesium_polylepis.1
MLHLWAGVLVVFTLLRARAGVTPVVLAASLRAPIASWPSAQETIVRVACELAISVDFSQPLHVASLFTCTVAVVPALDWLDIAIMWVLKRLASACIRFAALPVEVCFHLAAERFERAASSALERLADSAAAQHVATSA